MVLLALASDHGGFALKESLKEKLRLQNISFEDLGPQSEESVDYPDYAAKVAQIVKDGKTPLGLLICGTGQGMAMAANKYPGVRAAVALEPYSARMAREHNDANILCLGGRVVGTELAWEILQAFLKANFSGGRHEARVNKIKKIEEKFLR